MRLTTSIFVAITTGGDANFYVVVALIGASEIDESLLAYQRILASRERPLLSLAFSRFFFRLASCNNNLVAFHLCFRHTLFNILPSYSRGAVLQFIRRRWQRQPPTESFGLIKFTDFHPPLYLPSTLLRHGTVSVSLRLRPSRFILAKRQSA